MEPSIQVEKHVASGRVIREWENRVAAEYNSAALAADLLHCLIVLGVSPDTLKDCSQIILDELRHAELSRDVALAAGGASDAIALDGNSMSIPAGPLLQRSLFFVSEFFCCGETVARPLFRAMQVNVKEALATQAIARIVKDEARHSAFGWRVLDELLERADEQLIQQLRERVPTHMARLRNAYGARAPIPVLPLTERELRWGLLERERYVEITEDCISNTLLKRFGQRGLA